MTWSRDIQPGLPYGWPAALTLLALFSLLAAAFLWPSVQSITHIWFNSETYAHGVIIPALALFLAWTRRRELARVVPEPTTWGILWLVAAGLAWILARSVDVKVVQHFALMAMLPGLVVTLLGVQVARILVFPLAYLFFAVPFGDFIVPVLQEYTAWFAVWLLQLSGLPMYREGLYISIPAGDFVVAEECSGVRYLFASVALGLIYAYISYRSLWRRAALVALAIALPIIANGIRAWGIIMIAHWTDMKHAVGVDHLIYGWVFFGFVMLLLFWLGSLWWEKGDHAPSGAPEAAMSPRNMPLLSSAGLLLALVAVLAAPRGGELWMEQRARSVVWEEPPSLPVAPAGWSGPHEGADDWRPRYFDADTEMAGVYRSGGDTVELHLYRYPNLGQGSEIVSWRNRIYDGTTWRRSSERTQSLSLNGGVTLQVHETVLRGPGGVRRIVWHWYQVGDHATRRGVEVKLREAAAVFAGDGRGAFLVAASTEDADPLDPARERLARFVRELSLPLGYASD
jgi:exosortase A